MDDVFHGGRGLRLAECLHCEHRWTETGRRAWKDLGATMRAAAAAPRPPAA